MIAPLRRAFTLWRLGPGNLLRAVSYRARLKAGLHPVQRLRAAIPPGSYFAPVTQKECPGVVPKAWTDHATLFGRHRMAIGDRPPDWHRDPFETGIGIVTSPLRQWWTIPDFAMSDIKNVWELSRLDWVLAFAQQARCGVPGSLERLNGWLEDWSQSNPPYVGPNWKCGQEASIRLIHLSLAALIMKQEALTSSAVKGFVDAHVARIQPTISYAIAQDNNHATSEAAALFIAGAWGLMAGHSGSSTLEQRGRTLLERSTARLFEGDGTFSQYSVTYHRLALDTLAVAELWRRRVGLPPLSRRFMQRAGAATEWLRVQVSESTGGAPNIGANDGANLLPLTDADYRDFRTSVQIASALFLDASAYSAGPWDVALQWLGLDRKERQLPAPANAHFPAGGFAVLHNGRAMAVLRYPRFRFRPSQADALHLDLWVDGHNLLRDGGTFRYNTDTASLEYFSGVESHNTVQFDRAPQMPRVSRFLLGQWLTARDIEFSDTRMAASYRSAQGWHHRREVRLGAELDVVDTLSGFRDEAVVRWRLRPGEWALNGDEVACGPYRLRITADVAIGSIKLVSGMESLYYGERSTLPVVEIRVREAGRVFSNMRWL